MWIAIAVGAQILTCLIALGLLWKDWHELSKRHPVLPSIVLILTLTLTGLSTALVVKGFRDADRQEAEHKGEAGQFQSTLSTLLGRIGELQKQVNTEPLLQQNKQLQQDLSDTKKLVQATKEQIGKPAPKAVLEGTFAAVLQDTTRMKSINVTPQPDGSVELKLFVMNTSNVQAKNGVIYLRICPSCKFVREPDRFAKAVEGYDYDREMTFTTISASVGVAVTVQIMPPAGEHSLQVGIAGRCENCEVRPTDILVVNY